MSLKDERVMMSSNNHKHAENDMSWYLDIGCSNHMTGKREWLVDLDMKKKSSIRFADNNTITAEGVGRVLITCKNGGVAYVDDVFFVPSMKSNLLSLGQLLEKGYIMSMHENSLEVFDRRKRLVIKAPLSKNRTFKVNLDASAIQCLSSINVDEES